MLRRVAATNPASNAIRAPRAAAIHPNFSHYTEFFASRSLGETVACEETAPGCPNAARLHKFCRLSTFHRYTLAVHVSR